MTQTHQGRKYDSGKLRYDLVPTLALEEVVKVITKGAEKYDDNNWKNVPDGRRRYYAASMRHMEAWRKGEKEDEIGTHHIANAISNLMFILEKELQGIEDIRENSAKEVGESVDNTHPYTGGWITWDGTSTPPDNGCIVEVKFRSCTPSRHWRVSDLNWEHSTSDMHYDIVAYRVVK